jgi:hypothetical protein
VSSLDSGVGGDSASWAPSRGPFIAPRIFEIVGYCGLLSQSRAWRLCRISRSCTHISQRPKLTRRGACLGSASVGILALSILGRAKIDGSRLLLCLASSRSSARRRWAPAGQAKEGRISRAVAKRCRPAESVQSKRVSPSWSLAPSPLVSMDGAPGPNSYRILYIPSDRS